MTIDRRTDQSADDVLTRAGIFQGVEPSAVSALRDDLTREEYSKGDVIIREGEQGDSLYIVTSGNPSSGKTFVSVNLAVAMAIKEHKVLLIDGDLRHASATRCFHPKSAGLADYLGERHDNIDELIVESQAYPNLYVLPVGTIPPNPTELLSGDRLSRLIAEVRHRYDFVLIDCPPTTTLADVDIIERHADRTLFIVRAGLFLRKRIPDLEADAANGNYKHLSVILNASDMGNRYGYRYGKRYGRYGRSYY